VPVAYAEIVTLLERGESLFTWWECAPASSWSTLRGMRPVLQRYFNGALLRIGERAVPMRAEVQIQRAFVALWSGQFDGALSFAESAASDLKWLACSGEMEVALRLFEMITDAIIFKPKRIATPMGTLGQILYALNPKSMDYILNSAYKLFPDSQAARGDKAEAAGRPTANEEASREQVAFAYLMRGVHW